MKLIAIPWSPSTRQIRQFGVISAFAIPLFGWLWRTDTVASAILITIGIAIAILSFAMPSVVKPIFVGLMLAAAPIGMLVGELAMLLIFVGIFLPIGLGFRLIQRDALKLTIDKNARTYWQPKPTPENVASYYRRY